MLPATGLAIGQGLSILGGAKAAREAGHQMQRGIQQGTIALQGGVDQAVAAINAPVDTGLVMNRPYSDAGVGAMANVNAMLGISGAQSTTQDVARYEKQLSQMGSKRDKINEEIAQLKKILASDGGFNKKGYRLKDGATYVDKDGKTHTAEKVAYSGMHRDQLQNRLSSLNEKIKTIDTEYKGVERTLRETTRQNELITAANQQAEDTGVQAIRPFSMDSGSVGQSDAYNFRLNQGLEAIDRRMAAGGNLNSGTRMTGLTDYAQGLASTEFENEFQRQLTSWRSQFDVLNANMAIAGMGQQATQSNIGLINNAGINTANTIMTGAQGVANLGVQGATTAAATTIGANNATQQGIGQLAYLAGNQNWFGGGTNNYVDPYSTGGEMHGIPDIEMK